MPGGFSAHVRMAPEQFDTYVQMVKRTMEDFRGRVDVLLGMESDYLPGAEEWLRKLHARAEFHYILGSVHPQIDEYRELYFTGDVVSFNGLTSRIWRRQRSRGSLIVFPTRTW